MFWRMVFKGDEQTLTKIKAKSSKTKGLNVDKKTLAKKVKRLNLIQLGNVFSNLTEQQKQQMRKYIIKGVAHQNWKLANEFEQFMGSLNVALRNKATKRGVTWKQQILIDIAKTILIDNKQSQLWTPGRSKWILALKYTASTKKLWVRMIRGTALYKFINVPQEDYLAILTCATTMGTHWWKYWYWKYSTNPKWKQLKRGK